MACQRKKCFKAGKITRNGFLNFMRDFRKANCGLSHKETLARGVRAWNRLSCECKKRYRLKGCGVQPFKKLPKRKVCRRKPKRRKCPPKRRKPRCVKRKRKPRCAKRKPKPKRRCAKRKPKRRACAKKQKYKCQNPGPVTSNGYLNFLRVFRKTNCNLTPQELAKRGAKCWGKMPEQQKNRYRRQACRVTTSPRHQRRQICQKKK